MCGIVGITSTKQVSSTIINSLKKLEYRGYDSAGIATLNDGYINEVKCEGRVESLEKNVTKTNLLGNVGIGHATLKCNVTGGCNTGVGYASLVLNTGSCNTGFGACSLYYNTTGLNNTAIGYQSLFCNSSGSCNVAVGVTALGANTTGDGNIAIGFETLKANTTGANNAAMGRCALLANTTGYGNTALGGFGSLCSNTTGYYNVAVGNAALQKNTTGLKNTASGMYALRCNTTSNDNTAVGTQALFTDTAAQNATRQFNATSQNQVEQFFKNLSTQVAQFNATQQNAQAQFNSGQTNTLARFNAELNNQRDQFNAQNQLVIAQSNAQWRRQIATADTAAINRTNELNASAILDISKTAYDNLWNFYADTMEWAVTAAENSQDRVVDMAIAELDAKTRKEVADEQSSSTNGQAVGGLIGTVLGAGIQHGFGNIFGCWVAREVYGNGDARWFVFRTWLRYDAPKWLQYLYGKYGQSYAKFIQNKPALKWLTKKAMDFVVERKRVKQNAFV